MFRSRIAIWAATALCCPTAACDHSKPKLTDEQAQRIRAALPGMTQQCFERVRMGGLEAFPERVDQCFEMTPQRRWRGLWTDYFEGQQFCPAPARDCTFDESAPRIWLSFANGTRPTGKTASGGAYTIEFIGRVTRRSGNHGHLGMFTHEILVDQLISILPSRNDKNNMQDARK